MTDTKFHIPVADTLASAWNKVHGSKKTFWAGLGILIAVIAIFAILQKVTEHMPVLSGIINVIGQVITYLIQAGLIYIGIKRAYDLPINYRMMFRAFEGHFILRLILLYIFQLIVYLPFVILLFGGLLLGALHFTGAGILGSLISLIGFLGLVYVGVRMITSLGFVIDKDHRPWQAIRSSFAATKCNFWRLFMLMIAELVILAVSMIPLGLGLIWTFPFVYILYGVIFKSLQVNVNQP